MEAKHFVRRYRNMRTYTYRLFPLIVAFLKHFRLSLAVCVVDDAVDWRLGSVGPAEGLASVGHRGGDTAAGCVLGLQSQVVVGSLGAIGCGVCRALTQHNLVQLAEVLHVDLV